MWAFKKEIPWVFQKSHKTSRDVCEFLSSHLKIMWNKRKLLCDCIFHRTPLWSSYSCHLTCASACLATAGMLFRDTVKTLPSFFSKGNEENSLNLSFFSLLLQRSHTNVSTVFSIWFGSSHEIWISCLCLNYWSFAKVVLA